MPLSAPHRKRPRDARPRPWAMLGIFLLVTVILYLVTFLSTDAFKPKLGIDLQGGTRVTLVPRGAPTDEALDQAVTIVEQRVNGMGVSGSQVVRDGRNLVLTVPGQDATAARELGATAKLTIRPVEQAIPMTSPLDIREVPSTVGDPDATAKAIEDAKKTRQADTADALATTLQSWQCPSRDVLAGVDNPDQYLLACGGGMKYLLAPEPVVGDPTDPQHSYLDGEKIERDSVSAGFNQQQGQTEVAFRFSTGGANPSAVWSRVTQENLSRQVAILMDNEVISAPVIQGVTPAGSTTSITGLESIDTAQALASNLRFGALPISFEDPNVDNVPASLGQASLNAGLLAGAIGLLLILLYALMYYRAIGFLAFISLVCALILTYGVLVLLGNWINYSLDLAGIAGVIIGIGMTADSFVVFFERIKDELRAGHRFRSAVPRGWKRASRTIVTGKMVSLIGAVVLYMLAIGEVRGFAFTLGLTTVMDILVAFTVTWPLVYLASTKPVFSRPAMNGLGSMESIRSSAAKDSYRPDTTTSDSETSTDSSGSTGAADRSDDPVATASATTSLSKDTER